MRNETDIVKGTHPGIIISGELRQRKFSQRTFADSIGVHFHALNVVITGRRNLKREWSLRSKGRLGTRKAPADVSDVLLYSRIQDRTADTSIDGMGLGVRYGRRKPH